MAAMTGGVIAGCGPRAAPLTADPCPCRATAAGGNRQWDALPG